MRDQGPAVQGCCEVGGDIDESMCIGQAFGGQAVDVGRAQVDSQARIDEAVETVMD